MNLGTEQSRAMLKETAESLLQLRGQLEYIAPRAYPTHRPHVRIALRILYAAQLELDEAVKPEVG